MNSRRLILAILTVPLIAAGMGAAPAPAAGVVTPTERCQALEKQFDQAIRRHEDTHGVSTATLAAAKTLRAEGEKLCSAGRHAAGALDLARALADLGIKADDK